MAEDSLIEASQEIMHGTPVFASTRVPVKTLFDYLKVEILWRSFSKTFPPSVVSRRSKCLKSPERT
jgi:uncharacterized protein (DUF433 family)